MPLFIFFTIFFILVLVLGWHIIFALMGGAIVIGAAIWGIAVTSILIFCIAVLLAFFLTGIGGIIIGLIFAVWTIVAVVLFPVLFPILLPLFIIYAFISYFRKKKQNGNP